MTFSLIGRCERTGMFGIAISTSEMAVGSRCIHVAPGVGAVVCQIAKNKGCYVVGSAGSDRVTTTWTMRATPKPRCPS